MNKIAPPHKSEKQFRRYEPHIRSMLGVWPDAYMVDPCPLSATTFTARMRDAIASFIEFGWNSDIDLGKLQLIRPQLEISVSSEGIVTCGKQGTSKALAIAGKVTSAFADQKFSAEVDSPDAPTVHALAFLLSRKTLKLPAKITNLDPSIRSQVLAQYDIAFAETADYVVMV